MRGDRHLRRTGQLSGPAGGRACLQGAGPRPQRYHCADDALLRHDEAHPPNAEILCEALGVTFGEINITETVKSHFADIDQPADKYDVTFETARPACARWN